jgi:hypothetical protein
MIKRKASRHADRDKQNIRKSEYTNTRTVKNNYKNNANLIIVKTNEAWYVIHTKQRSGGKEMHELTATT